LMVAAIIAFIASSMGAPYLLALVIGVLAAAVLGAITERAFIRPLLQHDAVQVETLFITLGLSIVLENLTLLLWGSQPHYFNNPFAGVVEFGGIILTVDRIVTIVVAAAAFFALHIVATRTRFGKAV